MQGLMGKKLGMTQVFDKSGRLVPVTVIEAGPCVVVQRRTAARDGYEAVQLGFLEGKESRAGKAALGHFKKAGVTPKRCLREFALDAGEELKAGDAVGVSIFEGATHVDVGGVTKGQGFQGVVRRHGMAGGPMTHGHTSHRRIGAIGQRARPGNIAKGHRMPGHMGHVRVTQQNLRIVEVRSAENLMLVEGAVPGPTGAVLTVLKALKKRPRGVRSGGKK
jgi:large subunit ribosomal protein L3